MIIDNRLKTAKLKLLFIIFPALALFLFIYAYFEGPKLSNHPVIMILVGMLVLAELFLMILNLKYFYFDDDKNKVVIRFYNVNPFYRKYMSIEFQKSDLDTYKIENTFGGLKKELILSIRLSKGIAKYPPVNITTLTKNEIYNLDRNLYQMQTANQKNKK